jgi:hypothetical protein
MSKDQPLEGEIEKVWSERPSWTDAWEQAWEAYQGQQKPGGDEKRGLFFTIVQAGE